MKKSSFIILMLLVVISSFSFLQSCDKKNSEPATLTLYDSLGGSAQVNDPAHPGMMIQKGRLGIRSVVDSTIFVIAADAKINSYFNVLLTEVSHGDLSGFNELSQNLTDLFCVATGSTDYTYMGLSMKDAHNPAVNPRINGKVDSGDFDQFVNDLVEGAKKNAIPDYLIARVGDIVVSLKADVVQR